MEIQLTEVLQETNVFGATCQRMIQLIKVRACPSGSSVSLITLNPAVDKLCSG